MEEGLPWITTRHMFANMKRKLVDIAGWRMRRRPIVMGVGWAKTGTTSLGSCLRYFGMRHATIRVDAIDWYISNRIDHVMRIARCYDSFEDWPWLLLYREFDNAFPGMKFVLTKRNSAAWLKSYLNQLAAPGHGSPAANRRRERLYGVKFPDPDPDALVARYELHNKQVQMYFAGRTDDLLVVDWEQGDGWGQLAPFLGRAVPEIPFPHANRAVYGR